MPATRITITIETVIADGAEPAQMRTLITDVLRRCTSDNEDLESNTSADDGNPETGGTLNQGVNPSGWTFRDFEELWDLLSPGAKRVLAELAQRPDGYPDRALQDALDMDLQTIGGFLASLGRRKSRFAKQEPVYRKDATTNWEFVLAPEVAGYILLLWRRDNPQQ